MWEPGMWLSSKVHSLKSGNLGLILGTTKTQKVRSSILDNLQLPEPSRS